MKKLSILILLLLTLIPSIAYANETCEIQYGNLYTNEQFKENIQQIKKCINEENDEENLQLMYSDLHKLKAYFEDKLFKDKNYKEYLSFKINDLGYEFKNKPKSTSDWINALYTAETLEYNYNKEIYFEDCSTVRCKNDVLFGKDNYYTLKNGNIMYREKPDTTLWFVLTKIQEKYKILFNIITGE